MSRTFRTVGSGASQTTEPIENNKIPVYETKVAAEADIANLSDGQIIATKDEGNENAKPVDVVESGNLHAVTSNAVADNLSYSTQEVKTGGTWIDGKPIYRKVVEVNGIIPDEGFPTGCPAGSLIISMRVLQTWNDTTWDNPYTPNNLMYVGSCLPAMIISSDGTLFLSSTSNTALRKYTKCVIIEYTKPTD